MSRGDPIGKDPTGHAPQDWGKGPLPVTANTGPVQLIKLNIGRENEPQGWILELSADQTVPPPGPNPTYDVTVVTGGGRPWTWAARPPGTYIVCGHSVQVVANCPAVLNQVLAQAWARRTDQAPTLLIGTP